MNTTKLITLTVAVLFFSLNPSLAQNLNWASLKAEQRNILNVNAGFDYAFTYGVGYGYQSKTKLPIVLNAQYSQAAGGNLLDDFKAKIGGEIRLYQINNFHFSTKIQGIFRRSDNNDVRLLNFGSDLSGRIGYYKPKWFVAGEFGFDKAIVTNFKHSHGFKENYPNVKDGWYEPATGGNFYYGVQTGYAFKSSDITLKIGRVIQQDFKTSPTVPFYFQVGYNRKF